MAESAGAGGVAEALRLVLVEDDLGPNQTERDVDVLQESVDDLPGEPEVSGIADDDGDGVDDDGKVEVRVMYRPDQEDFAKRHLQAGIGAIEKFSAAYVPYPWPIMTIIDPPPDAAGGADE